ncbi:MAG: KH domain-containing protein [Actinobacteria bacterium]|nr:KH domain-containing protein [Actinomycetota bacterium]
MTGLEGDIIVNGNSVDEAVAKGAEKLGLEFDEVDYEVIGEKGRKILGFGNQKVEVRVFKKKNINEMVKDFVINVVKVFDSSAVVECKRDNNVITIDISGDDSAIIIGRHGTTLNALQFITEIVANRTSDVKVRVFMDVDGYKRRQDKKLEDFARSMAQKAIRERRDIALRPMTARERKIVHNMLAADTQVRTESLGEEPDRRVIIRVAEKFNQKRR